MSSLTTREKGQLEKLLEMGSGYVLNFNNRTFGYFFSDTVDVDIHHEKYADLGSSKANKMRSFWHLEDDVLVGRLLHALVDLWWEQRDDVEPDEEQLAGQCRDIARRLTAGGTSLNSIALEAKRLDAVHLWAQIKRLESSIDRDPSLAIGTAKELIETVCKTILAERGCPVPDNAEMPALSKATFAELQLVPRTISDGGRADSTVRKMLGSLGTVSQSLAELRNVHGTGHGKDGRAIPLETRHARLAVNAAATLATFLLETHVECPTGGMA